MYGDIQVSNVDLTVPRALPWADPGGLRDAPFPRAGQIIRLLSSWFKVAIEPMWDGAQDF